MLKYILKRLGISVIILFGVSVIIYSLVRMMPNDYIDIKYSSQLQSGAISQDDVDRFKELYGLSVPDAFYSVDINYQAETEGGKTYDLSGKYTKKARTTYFENAILGGAESEDLKRFIDGKYSCDKYTLEIDTERGVALIYESEEDPANKKGSAFPIFVGTFSASTSENAVTLNVLKDGKAISSNSVYRLATSGEKFSSILSGYFIWIGNLIKGDLGRSFKYEKPVTQVISENMWISFAIALVATFLQFLIAIPLGISGATHQYSVRDYTVTVFTMIGISLPTYFFAAIVIKLFSVDLKLFPPSGLIYTTKTYPETFVGFITKFGDILHHLALPILVNVILSIGGLMRYTRTNTLEVLNSDYIRTARAKGLSEKTVIYKHAFRNTMIPLATLLAGILPSLFGGMMITEEVFCIDGIGRLAYQALREGDVPFVMGYNMFLAILTVIGTLFSDIMYSVVDPRVKLGD